MDIMGKSKGVDPPEYSSESIALSQGKQMAR